MLRRARAPLALLALLAGGCLTGSTTLPTSTSATLVTADPLAFQGSAVCGTELRSYVVTITDVTEASITLRSSPPSPCTNPVSFGQPTIVVGDLYTALIEGYDRNVATTDQKNPDPGDITPVVPGNPTMVDRAGQQVLPRWTTTCGLSPPAIGGDDASSNGSPTGSPNPLASPVQAKLTTEVFLRGCVPFGDIAATGTSSETGAPRLDADAQPDSSVAVESDAAQIGDAGPMSSEQDP